MVEPSSSDPAAQSADEVERALFECLEQADPPAAIDAVCRGRPEIAADLRRRYAWIAEHGTRYQPSELPDRFGEFTLRRRLGTGGMGVVHLAVQERLGREVALKVLRPEYLHFARARERFEREARAASRLDHAGICQVYEAGEVAGTPYIAMRYVRGRTLAETIAESRASGGVLLETTRPGTTPGRAGTANTLEMIERVARALDVAHAAGLVHRDVKPGNIILEPDGNPVVLDFGLVRDETADAKLTRSAEWLGTPSYMAPEQISPRGRSIDRRTDVYGLGVTLYECLTLRCPFEAETREDLCRSILTDEPKPPSRLSRHLPRDLDVVLAKALDKDPERRYTTALELAEDLRRVRSHEPILARRATWPLRARKWVERNPIAATFLAVVTAGLTVALVLLAQRNAALKHSRAMALAGASAEELRSDPQAALHLAVAAQSVEATPATLAALRAAVAASRERTTYGGHQHWVWQARVVSGDRVLTAAQDGNAVLWPLDGSRALAEFPHGPLGVRVCTAMSADGKYVVTGGSDGHVRLWLATGEAVETEPMHHGDLVTMVGVHPSAELFLSAWDDGKVRIHDTTGRTRALYDQHGGLIATAVFNRDGNQVLTASVDRTARLWDWATGTSRLVARMQRPLRRAVFFPDETQVLVQENLGEVAVWSLADGKPLRGPVLAPAERIIGTAISPDGSFVATTADDGRCRVWKRSGELHADLGRHSGRAFTAAISARGIVATGGEDDCIRLWTLGGDPLGELRGHLHQIHSSLSFSADDLQLLSASVDCTARLWDVYDQGQPHLVGHAKGIMHLAPLGDGWLTVSLDRTMRVWDRGGLTLRTVPLPDSRHPESDVVDQIALSPDGSRLVTVARGSPPIVWRLPELVEDSRGPPPPANDYWYTAAFSPDGESLAIASYGQSGKPRLVVCERDWSERLSHDLPQGHLVTTVAWHPDKSRQQLLVALDQPFEVWIFDLATQRFVQKIESPRHGGVNTAAWSPDGRHIVTGQVSGRVALWEAATGRHVRDFAGHVAHASRVVWFPDGSRFATTSRDRTARVFAVAGETLAVLEGHSGMVTGACWSDGGKSLATCSMDRTVRFWRLDPAEILALARQRIVRPLSNAVTDRWGHLLIGLPSAYVPR